MARVIELRSCKNGSITSTISDQDLFDCPIWYQALKVPVSQSINGHIICSSCLAKVNNKSPACRSCVMLRSRVMNIALEVIQLKCKNSEMPENNEFRWKNGKTFVSFTYKKRVKVTLNVNDSVFLFRQQKNGHLFSLKNVVAG
ncbi:hypothetical protein WN943_005214 [Citrus x changshan-huyou]